ncbi:MAG: glutamyl-tRNA amidotransferase [Gammaproteobacteria bacterium]|nr:MAG: glutamyl-tRNA amidotransferase [Gammaproteobacteria bacterium]
MSLLSNIQAAIKVAMKEKDKARLTVLRSYTAAIKQREIDEQITLDDTGQLAVLDKLIKQRKDSESQFRDANRADLADKEAYEIAVLSEFLPQPLSDDEIMAIIEDAITESGAENISAMGRVMNLIKPRVQGRADMATISQLVKAKL